MVFDLALIDFLMGCEKNIKKMLYFLGLSCNHSSLLPYIFQVLSFFLHARTRTANLVGNRTNSAIRDGWEAVAE